MKKERNLNSEEHQIAHGFLRVGNSIIDFVFIALMIALLAISIYMKVDIDSVYNDADPARFIMYKPHLPDETESFEELQDLNPDVIGWITIYGTNIDYPLLYIADGNNFYLGHNAKREIQSSGSIFIDYRNRPDFSDFNTIVHGHHMERHEMFGDIDLFRDSTFFQNHEYGNVYFNGKNYGLDILVFLETDGYNWEVYYPGVTGEVNKLEYLNTLYNKATYIRGIENLENFQSLGIRTSPITPDDHIILLSTCAMDITNGRMILVAKLLDHSVDNPYPETELERKDYGTADRFNINERVGRFPIIIWIGIVVVLILITSILYLVSRWRDNKNVKTGTIFRRSPYDESRIAK